MTSISAHDARDDPPDPRAFGRAAGHPISVGVQVISTLFYGAFAITVTAIAFAHFWPAGVALAVILGWRGGFVPGLGHGADQAAGIIEGLRHLGPEASARSSGNASFDAYREDTLQRLEVEQESFSAFLDRLRDARDQREFDSFLDDRAEAARTARLDIAGA